MYYLSQDGCTLTESSRLFIKGSAIYAAATAAQGEVKLAEYKTLENAQEVLRKIYHAIEDGENTYYFA